MEKEKKYPIYIILLVVMLAWGFNVVATKVLVTTFPPVTLTSLRIFTAGIFVFMILFFLKKVRLPSRREIKYIFVATLFNVVGHQYFLTIGLTETSATNAGLILGMSPLLTTLFAIVFWGNLISWIRAVGILLGLIGVSLIVLSNGSISDVSIGDVHSFISVVSIAISFILIKKVANTLDPRLMTAYMLVIGSFFLFILSLFLEPNGLENMVKGSVNIWILFLASALFSTALGHMLYNYAIGKVGAAEASIFTNFTPFFAIVGAVIFLDERLAFSQIMGFILIIIGVMFGSGAYEELRRNKKQKQVAAVTKIEGTL